MTTVVLGETETSVTLATNEMWFAVKGSFRFDDETMNTAWKGMSIKEGDSILLYSGMTVFYAPAPGIEGGLNILMRVSV